MFFTLILFTSRLYFPSLVLISCVLVFWVYFYLIWGVMCSSVLSLNYDSRKQQMISIFSFVTVWTNWNRTQNSICVVLSPGTTSRLLSSFFSYVWLIKPSPWPTTHQAGEPEKVPLHRQRCSLCVLVGFGDGDQICFFHVVITRGASSHTGKKSLTGL